MTGLPRLGRRALRAVLGLLLVAVLVVIGVVVVHDMRQPSRPAAGPASGQPSGTPAACSSTASPSGASSSGAASSGASSSGAAAPSGGATSAAAPSTAPDAPAPTPSATAAPGGTGSSSDRGATPATGTPRMRLYVAPHASGDDSGCSWGNAAELADLPRLVSQLPSGGEIWLRADQGAYQVPGTLVINGGGASGAPVVVRGVDADGRPTPAVLQGTRTSPYQPHAKTGGDVFSLRRTEHLAFRDLAFQNVGNAFLASGDVTDLAITDTTATNVRRFFANTCSSKEGSAVVTGLTLRGITVSGFSKRVLELRYTSSDVLVEDVVGDSQQQDKDNFAIGVHLEEQVHDVTLRRVTMRNIKDSMHKYWNGDGFATERDVHDIAFEDTTSSDNTDGGYDLKSTRTTLTNVVASGNKRNFRLWADDLVLRGCTSTDPQKRGGIGSQAQVWLGEDAAVQITDCTFSDDDPATIVFYLEPGARVSMTGGQVTHAGKLQQLQKGATVNLSGVAQ